MELDAGFFGPLSRIAARLGRIPMSVDPGTRRVVTDGARILHDPADILTTLLRACG